MPFKSKAQQGFLYAKKPKVAKEFASKTPASAYANLPEHVDPYRPENQLYAGKKRRARKNSRTGV